MSAEVRRLPVSPSMVDGEAVDGYLERLAGANGMTHPQLVGRLVGTRTAFLTTAPGDAVGARIAALSTQPAHTLRAGTLASLPGIDTTGLDPTERASWRTVAARGWPPERGTSLCARCIAEDGIWRLAWRHPWVTACTRHRLWLIGTCPTCRRRFRSQRTALRSVDAPAGTCGNPVQARGSNCAQPLDRLLSTPAPDAVLATQGRIDSAIAGEAVAALGAMVDPTAYLAELKALTVLLLHLAVQPGADSLVPWAALALVDRDRSAGVRGARWGLSPPTDLELRGQAIASADTMLRASSLDAAADSMHPWTELTPRRADGQLGWLADHTTMTPTLSRLVMAATAPRRRIATLLDHHASASVPAEVIPQVVPAERYAAHLVGMLGVRDQTGRLFVSLCLARRYAGATTWAEAATVLGLPAETGVRTARACSADRLVRVDTFVSALDDLAADLDLDVDFRAREAAVRRLAGRSGWYRHWARTHHPGSHENSRGYAITWLWTEYAHGHIDTSPGWATASDYQDRARYRRYAQRLSLMARPALIDIADTRGSSRW